MKVLCIYHANCQDGLAAGAVVSEFARVNNYEFEAFPGKYGEPPPLDKIDNKTMVYVVDFSYKPEILIEMSKRAWTMMWIDHHDTALQAWADYQGEKPPRDQLGVVLDLNRSGAKLAFDTLLRVDEDNEIINHVSDRDLWAFKLLGTKYICEYGFTLPRSVSAHHDWIFNPPAYSQMFDIGKAIYDQRISTCRKFAHDHARILPMFGQTRVAVMNVPYYHVSDACEQACIAHDVPLSLGWFDEGPSGLLSFSLRSRGVDRPHCGEIAKRYKGGGHPGAAGFRMMRGEAVYTFPELFGRVNVFPKGD